MIITRISAAMPLLTCAPFTFGTCDDGVDGRWVDVLTVSCSRDQRSSSVLAERTEACKPRGIRRTLAAQKASLPPCTGTHLNSKDDGGGDQERSLGDAAPGQQRAARHAAI